MYKHVLFATDFSPEAGRAELRAQELAEHNMAQLSVVHAIDYYPSASLEGSVQMYRDLESRVDENAQTEMTACIARLGLKPESTHIGDGPPKHVITDHAVTIGADLIVIGSHGRHGLGLLLGSTANAVLHVAKCDVLAVRVGK